MGSPSRPEVESRIGTEACTQSMPTVRTGHVWPKPAAGMEWEEGFSEVYTLVEVHVLSAYTGTLLPSRQCWSPRAWKTWRPGNNSSSPF